jgi:hypothetical protein
VQAGRVRRARQLVPVDRVEGPTASEWSLCAALHDLLQSANPTFDAPLRRGAAARIRDVAVETIDRVPAPGTVRDALNRHTWLARLLEIARTDTRISWWSGWRAFRGVDPPARLRSWPDLRRVRVIETSRPLLELAPLAFDRTTFVGALARLLARTPLTDLATCTRAAPAFAWTDATLALLATRAGRTLAMRALARLPAWDVDAALGGATRAMALQGLTEDAVLALLGERAIAAVQGHVARGPEGAPGARLAGEGPRQTTVSEATFARALGAAVATKLIEETGAGWREEDLRRLLAALAPAARSAAAREALAMVQTPA